MKLEDDLEHLRVPTRGTNLHVVAKGPEDGPLVVLLHGFPEFWYGWRHQIGPLAAAGYRVIAPDQRGYNESDKPAGRRAYRLQHLSEDVADLIERFGRHKAHALVGHDWGGAVTWDFATRFPERVDRLAVLNCPQAAVFARKIFTSAAQARRAWYILFFQLPGAPERLFARSRGGLLQRTANPGAFRDEDIARYLEAWRKPGAIQAMINWYRAGPLNSNKPRRVRQPTLILWGRNDPVLTPELAEDSAALCDDGRLIFLDEATHWVQHDAPEEVNERLLEHLEG